MHYPKMVDNVVVVDKEPKNHGNLTILTNNVADVLKLRDKYAAVPFSRHLNLNKGNGGIKCHLS